ncbi:MAG: tRNA (5-methylaminomethyl-2-thiouridine)(34)-methyltransferase MnmD [Actinomycetota bacterium]
MQNSVDFGVPAADFFLMDTRLIITLDGSHTLYVPGMDEHYHSRFGAMTESEHIFINAGLNTIPPGEVSILEVGFGTGLNALLTAVHSARRKLKVIYTSLEKEPVDQALISRLNYGSLAGEGGQELFDAIHAAPWNSPSVITEWFTIEKRVTDLIAEDPAGIYDLVYFDAFGPDKQPEMWKPDMISKIAALTRPGSVFVTYSAKGNLKRMLRSLGFDVTHLPGPPGKRVFTRAVRK